MSQEYELISHDEGNYHLFLVNMIYRTPHIHLDFEFLLVLSGTIDITMQDGQMRLTDGELGIINPLESHEFHCASPALLLLLQIPPSFLASICPEADHLEFETRHIKSDVLKDILIRLALSHFKDDRWSNLYCISQVTRFLYELLLAADHHERQEQSWKKVVERGDRLYRIMDYIAKHYSEKITLKDVADMMGVSTYYLSHYFKNAMGVSLQECLTRYRCEQARRLLLTTDETTLDISLMCGFSDPKYFTRGFKKLYGMLPGEYRRAFRNEKIREQQSSMLSTQEFLSDEASLVLLSLYVQEDSAGKIQGSENSAAADEEG